MHVSILQFNYSSTPTPNAMNAAVDSLRSESAAQLVVPDGRSHQVGRYRIGV